MNMFHAIKYAVSIISCLKEQPGAVPIVELKMGFKVSLERKTWFAIAWLLDLAMFWSIGLG